MAISIMTTHEAAQWQPYSATGAPVHGEVIVTVLSATGEESTGPADSFEWGECPEPDGQIVAYRGDHDAPAGWIVHSGATCPVARSTPVEVESAEVGDNMIALAGAVGWGLSDEPGARVARYRTLYADAYFVAPRGAA